MLLASSEKKGSAALVPTKWVACNDNEAVFNNYICKKNLYPS